MSNIWFCSDLHFGHKNIGNFRKEIGSEAHNVEIICSDWISNVSKRDVVYVLGDACFNRESLDVMKGLPGMKYLVRGNHDTLPTTEYLEVFKEVYGVLRYKSYWLSHAPIHPDELRGHKNLHGHVHSSSIRKPFNPVYDTKSELDNRYFNCCPENLWPLKGRAVINLDEIRELVGT